MGGEGVLSLMMFTACNEVGQGYIFTGVCDSVHGGGGGEGLPQSMLGYHPLLARQTPQQGNPPWQGRPPPTQQGRPPTVARRPPGKADTPAQCMLGDMVNKQVVCILLECNPCFVIVIGQ